MGAETKEQSKNTEKVGEAADTKTVDPNAQVLKDLEEVMNECTVGVESDVLQLVLVARKINKFRSKLNEEVLKKICDEYVPRFHLETMLFYLKAAQGSLEPPSSGNLLPEVKQEPEPMEVEGKLGEKEEKSFIPENVVFVYLVLVGDFITAKKWKWVVHVVHPLLEYVNSLNRRTMDHLASVCYQYYSLAFTKLDRLTTIRKTLNEAFRTAVLRHNYPCQAVLLNLLLQNYLHEDKYTEAEKLIARTKFPEKAATAQVARFQFYSGRINLVQLQYSDALSQFRQALRKTPSANGVALGFRFQIIINYVMCQLLLSEVPEMDLFRTAGLTKPLKPYYDLCVVLQVGNLKSFTEMFTKHEHAFMKDKMDLLVQRLRNTVIKTGLRKINLAYSRMKLETVRDRLGMNSVEDTKWVVAKAIRDKIIEARLDYKTNTMISNESHDVYRTKEPAMMLQERTDFLFNVYQDAMKAFRYLDKKEEKEEDDEDKEPEEEKEKIEEDETDK